VPHDNQPLDLTDWWFPRILGNDRLSPTKIKGNLDEALGYYHEETYKLPEKTSGGPSEVRATIKKTKIAQICQK